MSVLIFGILMIQNWWCCSVFICYVLLLDWLIIRSAHTSQLYVLFGLFNTHVTNWLILYWPCIESMPAVLALDPTGLRTVTATANQYLANTD